MHWRSIWQLANDELVRRLPAPDESWRDFQECSEVAEAVAQDLRIGEKPHEAAIAAAIDAWTRSGEWPWMKDPVRHCIRLRLSAAALFLFLLFEEGQDFLPLPPHLSEREILRWFLTGWWHAHGLQFFADHRAVRRESEGGPGEL